MPRTYKKKPGTRHNKNYPEGNLNSAILAIKKGMNFRKAAEKYGVPASTIALRKTGDSFKKYGDQTAFSEEEEFKIIHYASLLAEWGQPLTRQELRMIAKNVLDKESRVIL